MFADDSSLFSSICGGDATETVQELNQDLDCIEDWAKKWLISINPTKTVAMLFSLKKTPSFIPPLYLGDKQISLVPSHSHLGMTLTPKLTWSEHINKISTKCSKLLGILKRFKYRWSRKALETCYISFVRPIVEYGCLIYDSCCQADSDRLEKVQLEAARIATGTKKGTSCELLYSELGWPTLQERRKIYKLQKMYMLANNLMPKYLQDILYQFQR